MKCSTASVSLHSVAAMANINKMDNTLRVQGRAARAAVVLLMLTAVAVVARPVKLKDSTCTTSDTYVYPYWSLCDLPAELSTGYNYIPIAYSGLGLAPEYDETNATYYVGLSSSAATYVAVTESADSGSLPVNSTVYIYNSESGRALTWRQEGTDDYSLIEQYVSSVTSEGAAFRFLQATNVSSLPCPSIYPPAQCQAYNLVSIPDEASSSFNTSTGVGLQAYQKGYSTYIKAASASLGSTGNLPFLLTPSYGFITTSAIFPTIRSVTAPE